MPPPMAADVMAPARKVAKPQLDIRPALIAEIYKRRRVPLDFARLATEHLEAPCDCGMCRGVMPWRSRKQVENYRNKLARNPFKRSVVMCRDGWRCVRCGSEEDLTIDHVVGLARGGSNAYHNLRVLCMDCHVTRADSHSPRMLARHLANLIDDLMPVMDPATVEERRKVDRLQRLIESIRGMEVA